MNTVLWIAQGLAAALFLMSGFMKATKPISELAVKMPWVNDFSPAMVRFIGVSQLLGAVGLIIPMVTGILPILTPIAAAGLALNMVFAAIYHAGKKEYNAFPINGALFALAAFVAVGRFII